MEPRIYVVADAPEAERIARWVAEDLGCEVRAGAASDETLADLLLEPPEVVVLTAGLSAGDALSFAGALRGPEGGNLSLVLIADENGPVRNALDAMPFRADRFLRRPLSRSALRFAVRSCLNLGRAGVLSAVQPPPASAPPLAAVLSVLGEIAPAPTVSMAAISSGVVLHTLDARLDQATSEAIDAFLQDAVDAALSQPPLPVEEQVAGPAPARTDPSGGWREPTLVLQAAPQAPEEMRTGTFVSALRRHMSAVEARLFGAPAEAPVEDDAAEIDLDAIGVTSVTPVADDEAAPPVTDLDPPPPAAQATVWPGDLAGEDVASLLGRLAREGATARVTFRRDDREKIVWLEEGRPVFAASRSPADRMGELLLREGKITREQLARASEALVASGRRLGEILVEQGALKRRELYPSVRHHVEDLLYALFAWEGGSYALTPATDAREEKIRLAAPASALVCEGIRRKMGIERLRALVGPPHVVLVPRRRDDLGDALADADLASEERGILPLFDGRRSLAEIVAEGDATELVVYQLAHALRALDLATPAATDAHGTTEVRAATTGVVAGTADAGIDRERVLSKYAQVLEADYFEILGLRRDASGYEVRRAYETARRDYAPESFAVEVQRELAAELAAIAEVLSEAQRVLRDDRMRAAYRDGLVDAAVEGA